jgi:hypothetical protein
VSLAHSRQQTWWRQSRRIELHSFTRHTQHLRRVVDSSGARSSCSCNTLASRRARERWRWRRHEMPASTHNAAAAARRSRRRAKWRRLLSSKTRLIARAPPVCRRKQCARRGDEGARITGRTSAAPVHGSNDSSPQIATLQPTGTNLSMRSRDG